MSAVWDLDGDNSFETAGTGMTATRSFPKKGSYTVRVRVTDNLGLTATATMVVTVANRAAGRHVHPRARVAEPA